MHLSSTFHGKGCFIKLNWSSPRDAEWIIGTLHCKTVQDILLLLQSSDFIIHDLCHAYDDELEEEPLAEKSPMTLGLRKWCRFYDSMHFRCFVFKHTLFAISQRHCITHYPFLLEQQQEIRDRIQAFFQQFIQHQFYDEHEYVFDVYIDQQNRVYLIDFNVFYPTTDALLFDWKELYTLSSTIIKDPPLMRVVETKDSILPDPLSSYRVPVDFVGHLTNTPDGFTDFMNQVKENADCII